MPYPPNTGMTLLFRDYLRLLEKYANDSTLRSKVLAEKSELEHLIHLMNSNDKDIAEFFQYVSDASVSELKFDVRQYQRTIDDLPQSLHSDPDLNKPLLDWKHYLERTRDELKQAIEEKGGGVSAAQKRAAEVVSDVKVYLEAARLLEEQCEIDVKHNPGREKEIRRKYRKAIDALSEEEG